MAQDYSGKNLRGRNFKGHNLAGANFSYADIRGVDFTNANLKGANFTGAKAGLQRRWILSLILVSFILSALIGLTSASNGYFVLYSFLPSKDHNPIVGVLILIAHVVFLIITIHQGMQAALGVVAGTVTFTGAMAMTGIGAVPVAIAIAIAVAVAFAMTAAAVFAFVGAFAGYSTIAFFIAISLSFALCFTFTGVVSKAFSLAFTLVLSDPSTVSGAGTIAVSIAVTFTLLIQGFSGYIGWRALAGDEKQALIRNVAITFAATGGTSFRGANLTDANFSQATLKNTDFRKANLTRTRFYQGKQLDYASVGGTILSNLNILKLLVSGNGREKFYIGVNLRGANFIGFDFAKANFKNANITDATFCGACLEWANLTLTQAIGTDFTSAQMTGACVEAWNIESTTKLDNVDCRFVYLLENSKSGTDDRERRPSSGEFKPGEFTKLFEEVLNTVDLIFRNGVDWKAFIAAFKQVQVDNKGTELGLQSIENKGDGVIVVKVAVPVDADKEKIHSDLKQNYKLALKEVEKRYKVELQAKDNEIQIYRQQSVNMQEIIGLLASRPIDISIEAKSTSDSKFMTETRKTQVNQNNSSFGVGYSEKVTSQQIGGTIHNYAAQQNLVEAAKEIHQLLQQLEQNYPTDTLVQKAIVVEAAIKQIEGNPELKQRVIGAIKAGGIEAFKELTDHPLVNILVEAWRGWQEPGE